ncbi:hypothetical protein AYO40_04955 [Planctomycetaceae bacterium SCGC AG-212-D15]|nr:hypothetical protein AYO40_04955 [Planctomycetaceae bacterium SCGC AG-212-D15]
MRWLRWFVLSSSSAIHLECPGPSAHSRALALAALLLATFAANATDPSDQPGGDDVCLNLSSTRQRITIGEARLEYAATAGSIVLRDDSGKARANVFFAAYTKGASSRPILFLFNGGPGSSSAYLHLGAFGPRRALLEDDPLKVLAPPYRLIDNDTTLLDLCDLVFIDPVSTGYSRATSEEHVQQFHGVQEDAEAMAAFIRRYVKRFGREESAKFLVGESYGAARAAAVAKILQEEGSISVHGIILISMVLNFQSIRFNEGNDLPYPLFLPTYTATAWHHQRLIPKLQANLEQALAEAEKFAETE